MSCCDFQIFSSSNFTKELKENDHEMVIFLYSFLKFPFITRPTYYMILSYGPKYGVIGSPE